MVGPETSLASEGGTFVLRDSGAQRFLPQVAGEALLHYTNAAHVPWGWPHAYLNPDGHEISLYWAGENRIKKTVIANAETGREERGRQGTLVVF
jgi:hypothetical protein